MIVRYRALTGLARSAVLMTWLAAGAAYAGDHPRYEAPPAWVLPAPPIDPVKAAKGPPLVMLDMQQRIEGGEVWNYVDTAMRADTPEALTQMGTLTSSWSPDKGDLIIHRAQIIRADETVDLLAGSSFTILRREQQLEKRQLNGLLTATMPVPGLRVGDILRLSMTVTNSDKALAGRAQGALPLLTAPRNAGFARLRASWPEKAPVRWQTAPNAVLPAGAVHTAGGYSAIDAPLPLPKRDEMPEDAPGRFRMPTILQVGTFAGWEDVSNVMAPLFATEGLVQPGDPIDKEIQAIKAATPDPLARAARALELVQGRISYLLQGMNGGNYVPQTPAQTWQLRYGDCKAKTLLLLAMLRAMEIDAEPVLARLQGGDALPTLLPMPGDFDHVLVHARIGADELWLDGTDIGTKLADLRDTPHLSHVLPLRSAGAGLIALPPRANNRPNYDVDFTLDDRAGIDLMPIFDIAVTVRGARASQINSEWLALGPTERRNKAYEFLKSYTGDVVMADWSVRFDEAAGTATVAAKGVISSQWYFERGRMRQKINLLRNQFAPDRARPAWSNVPVAMDGPSSTAWHTTYLLPDGGAAMTLAGDPTHSSTVASAQVKRSYTLTGDRLVLVERADWTGAEVAPGDVAAEKARAAAVSGSFEVVAPAGVNRYWQSDPAKARVLAKPVEAVLTKAIAAWPEGGGPYESRANLRATLFDWRGALADIDKAIAIEPTADRHLKRLYYRQNLGDKAGALQDAEAALALEPGSTPALIAKAEALKELGKPDEGIALLEARVADTSLARNERAELVANLVEIVAGKGDTDRALTLADEGLASNPGDPGLLNARCWTKATKQVQLDTALRDCTRAIELSDVPSQGLDSRAMVYFRLGRMDDALADLNAALQSFPDLAASSYMRGIVLKRMGSVAEGEADIKSALLRAPTLQDEYRKFGVAP